MKFEDYSKNLSVFVVDDELEILKLVKKQLNPFNLQITTLTSGKELLELLKKVTPDLILLDVMIDMDGFEVCSKVKSETYAKEVPIIFMSSLGNYEDRVRGFEVGAVDYIIKPVDQGELLARVKVHLELGNLKKSLKKRNCELQRQIADQVKAELDAISHKETLEELLSERNIDLQKTNLQLQEEIQKRKEAEKKVFKQLEELEESKKSLLKLLGEEKMVRKKLRVNEERLSMAINASGAGIYEITIPVKDKLYVSSKWAEIIGYKVEELPEPSRFIDWVKGLIHEDDVDRVVKSCESFIDGKVEDCNLELRILHNSGKWIHVQGLSKVIEQADDGKIKHVIGLMTDITERKETEEKLKESEMQLKRAQEVAHVGSWFLDIKKNHLSWSDETYRIFSINDGSIMTYEDFIEACHPDDRLKIDEAWEQAIKGNSYNLEHRIIIDGKIKWVIEKAEVEFNESGEPVRGIGTIQDITERKREEERRHQLEEQLWHSQKMDAVGQLASGVAHDFNNLLQVIGGYTDLVKEILDRESPVQKHLGLVMNATEKATSLVRQLLLFSRNEKPVFRTIELNEVVKGILKMLERIIGDNISLEFEEDSCDLNVFADPGQIEQIIMNLCLNARDSLIGGGEIKISTGSLDCDAEDYCNARGCKSGNYVVITVSDNGSGMEPEIVERIFEPFFTTKEEGKGTGLGLATVYAIIKGHDGFIDVKSSKGEGSEFNIFLPAVPSPQIRDKENRGDGNGTIYGDKFNILFAEDDTMVRELSTRIMLHSGYKVFVASDGNEAERIIDNKIDEIDLAVLDMVMPGKGGKEIFKKLRSLKPDIPVIFSTGYTNSIIEEDEVFRANVILVRKPFRKEELLNAIVSVMKKEAN